MECCKQCGKELCSDEIGLHRKLVNRGATEFFCFHCLAQYFDLDETKFPELIQKFREDGCMLF